MGVAVMRGWEGVLAGRSVERCRCDPACPIEGFSPPDYDRILGLEATPFQTSVVCACGYRSASDKYAALAKVRYEASELIEQR